MCCHIFCAEPDGVRSFLPTDYRQRKNPMYSLHQRGVINGLDRTMHDTTRQLTGVEVNLVRLSTCWPDGSSELINAPPKHLKDVTPILF